MDVALQGNDLHLEPRTQAPLAVHWGFGYRGGEGWASQFFYRAQGDRRYRSFYTGEIPDAQK